MNTITQIPRRRQAIVEYSLRNDSKRTESSTSLFSLTRRGTAGKSIVLIAKTTSISMQRIRFTRFKILKSNLLFTAENTIFFLCVL